MMGADQRGNLSQVLEAHYVLQGRVDPGSLQLPSDHQQRLPFQRQEEERVLGRAREIEVVHLLDQQKGLHLLTSHLRSDLVQPQLYLFPGRVPEAQEGAPLLQLVSYPLLVLQRSLRNSSKCLRGAYATPRRF